MGGRDTFPALSSRQSDRQIRGANSPAESNRADAAPTRAENLPSIRPAPGRNLGPPCGAHAGPWWHPPYRPRALKCEFRSSFTALWPLDRFSRPASTENEAVSSHLAGKPRLSIHLNLRPAFL